MAQGNVKKVYVLFSNHLDIGYTKNVEGSTSAAVINQYFQQHFPKAIQTAEEARRKNKFRYSWMTHSWLVATYRNCNSTKVNIHGPTSPSLLVCPNASTLEEFEAAVRRGDINYHAFPFNSEPEIFTPELFDSALNLTFEQDDYFGHPRRKTLSQRDVPGLTRAAIPLLQKRGVEAITVGENAQVAPSAVPPIFVWKDNTTNSSVIALFHALGYGGSFPSRRRLVARDEIAKLKAAARKAFDDDKKLHTGHPATSDALFFVDGNGDMVMRNKANQYDDGPGMHVGADGTVINSEHRNEACVTVHEVALCYAWKLDNSGPHSYEHVKLIYDVIRDLYPGAELAPSDAFDDFISDIMPYKDTLPVITEEIGDTWIMGVSSDPLKVALYKSISRVHSNCVKDNSCIEKSNKNVSAFKTFERLLMVAGEHTWGWNGGDTTSKSWSNVELQNSLNLIANLKMQFYVGWSNEVFYTMLLPLFQPTLS